MKICIHGFYGHGNLGDEAILQATLNELKKFPDINPVIFTSKPNMVAKDYKVKSINSHHKKWDIIGILRKQNEIKNSNLFLLGGGGLLKDYGCNSENLKNWLKLLNFAQSNNIKNAFYSMGIEDIRFEESKKLLKDITKRLDIITVRDSLSKRILVENGVENEIRIMPDPAILLANEKKYRKRENNELKILISVRNWFEKGFFIADEKMNQNFIKSVAKSADTLIEKKNAKITFVPFRDVPFDNDVDIIKQILNKMKHDKKVTILKHPPKPSEYIKLAEKSSLIIGMRLHSLILGVAAGTPVIGLGYSPKVNGFMGMLEKERYLIDLEKINTKIILEKVNDVVQDYNKIRKELFSGVEGLRKKSRDAICHIINQIDET